MSEIQFAIKELGRDMSNPTQASWVKMKRALRYLKGVPRAVLHFEYQKKPKAVVTWPDSDFAGCVKSRNSTSAGVVMFGTHMWESWSTNQAVIALSSGEAEYYALVKAGRVSLGVQALMQEMGIHLEGAIELNSDANAAIDDVPLESSQGLAEHSLQAPIQEVLDEGIWILHQDIKSERHVEFCVESTCLTSGKVNIPYIIFDSRIQFQFRGRRYRGKIIPGQQVFQGIWSGAGEGNCGIFDIFPKHE